MSKTVQKVDLCIIGAGAAGLSIAAGAAQLGRSVVLYEAGKMGGDCLNHGCVPSKALIAAAKHAHGYKSGEKFGIQYAPPKVDFTAVKAHIKDVIATIAPVDSQERFEGLGVQVIREHARFKNKSAVVSKSTETQAKRIIIATGSRASAPPIPGLSDTPYFTNESIFDIDTLPAHLLIIGAGPIGLELGQAFRRLGSQVEIVDIAPPLGRHDADHVRVLVDALKSEGVKFHAPAQTKYISKTKTGVQIELQDGQVLTGSHILVAAGRSPVIDGLNLDAAHIKTDRKGIVTDKTLRTTNKKIYAVGDVSGRGGLTHAAGHHASLIIRNFYFVPIFKASVENAPMPAVIYSEPELATIGLGEVAARKAHKDMRVVHWDFAENDRAIAERHTRGGVKIFVAKNGKILGASIVGQVAGELLQIIALAMANGQKIMALTKMISPYPTRGEAVKRAASSFYTEAVFGSKSKKLAGFLSRFH